ncbi:Uncharacterised protein [Vibrio cholerae]|nr:Uncharacterised protein [Vibrio cholerae]CSC36050.1 Uncharacterised protein [Vibrio cholerae]
MILLSLVLRPMRLPQSQSWPKTGRNLTKTPSDSSFLNTNWCIVTTLSRRLKANPLPTRLTLDF